MHVTIMHILSLVEEEITERIQSDSLHCRRPRNRKPMNQANQNWVKKQSSVARKIIIMQSCKYFVGKIPRYCIFFSSPKLATRLKACICNERVN